MYGIFNETIIDKSQINKLMNEVKTCMRQYSSVRSLSELAKKLLHQLEEKQLIMTELTAVSHCIEKFHKNGSKSSMKQLLMMTRGDSLNEALPQSPGSNSFEEPDADLRKTALRNSMLRQKKTSEPDEDIKSPFDPARKPVTRADSRKSVILNEIKDILAANPPVAWNDDDDFNAETPRRRRKKRVHCYSPVLPYRKRLDKTEAEEAMENIFKNFTKPKRTNVSMTAEPGEEYQRDPRLDTSCAFDYSSKNCYFKQTKHKHCNSLVRSRVHGDAKTEDPAPKAYLGKRHQD